jgi:Carboxypeptidase regulatory-like domain
MVRAQIVASLSVVVLGMLLMPAAAHAQNTGIAGVVKDVTGAVLPGVTVEATSPALIERVRSVITDAQGLYSIVDLRPGTYSVTFTLTGFTSVKRDGIELTTSFTATVNAELKVGAIEETIQVSGQSPMVDTRNVVQSTVLTDAIRESLPTTRSALGMSELIPGMSTTSALRPTGHDVNGVADNRGASVLHGGRAADYQLQLDGAQMDQGGGATGQSWQPNPAEVQEYVYETGALSAENMGGGVRANVINKDGGNRFSSYNFFAGTNSNLQSNNITPALAALGASEDPILRHWDANFALGGPIKKDSVWFFASVRNWGEFEQIAGMYEAIDPRSFVFNPALGAAGNVDLSRPAIFEQANQAYGTRFTWQATPRNRFAIYLADQPRSTDGVFTSGTQAFEASRAEDIPIWAIQPAWKSPITSKLLLEASWTDNSARGNRRQPHENYGRSPLSPYLGDTNLVGVIDTGTGYAYRLYPSGFSHPGLSEHNVARAALSYVTGAHASKVGVIYEYGYNGASNNFHDSSHLEYTFRNGVPISLTEYDEPYNQLVNFKKLAFFAQDQWTFKRFTVNAGLRYDSQYGSVSGTQTSGPATQFGIPFQTWPQINDVPAWKDISPRLGVVYDLFGDGKTAVKYTLSRYVVTDGTGFQSTENPLTFNLSATRPWTDTNPVDIATNNFVPDCNLSIPTPNGQCGSLSNSAFGTAATTTHIDDALRQGWFVRPYDWETSASVQHQLFQGVSANFGYTYRRFGNFSVTQNQALNPAQYDQYCITAPTDPRLGSVSGSQICGLYDLNPAFRSVTPNNLVESATKLGTQTEHWSGIDFNVIARLPYRVLLSGGFNSGTGGLNTGAAGGGNATNSCFVVNSLQDLRFCNVTPPWLTSVKMLGSVDLKWGINVGATIQSMPGPQITAAYTVTNAQITSGQVQFVNPARTTFGGGSAVVQLITPGTLYQQRLNQVDVRLAKRIRYRATHLRATLDLGNILNQNAIQAQNNTFGANWQKPTYLLIGRIISPGILVEF